LEFLTNWSVETEITPVFTRDYDLFLFNEQKHLLLQGGTWITFYLLKKTGHKIMAQVSFHIEKDKAMSPHRAPFGSYLFSKNLSTLNLYYFIQECENRLREKKIKLILLKEPPIFYRTSEDLLQSILFNLGYTVSNAEIGSGINVGDEKFSSKIESWEKRKLKQAKAKGMFFKQLPLSEFENIYQFILKCRIRHGRSLSMTLDQLKPTVETFERSFFLFGTFLQKELTSASIAIKVNDKILYNFYSAHLKKYDSVSPTVLMIDGLYKFCASNNITLLDLGTSAIEGQPNFNLLDFKFRLGAVPSMKLTFEKELM